MAGGDSSSEQLPATAPTVQSLSRASKRNLLSTIEVETTAEAATGPHVKARSQHPDYPQRFAVPDERVAWEVPFPGYQPVEYTFKRDPNLAWVDGPLPDRALIESRGSHELLARQADWKYAADGSGRPLNPRGRTGISGRGRLGKWGPNHAGDAIVTRFSMKTVAAADGGGVRRVLEMVAIKRMDTGEWAIPGGMTDPHEVGVQAVLREFREEAASGAASEKALVEELFAGGHGRVVYRGYVDDPRNTDHAWMETVAMHFHCEVGLGEALQLRAGDDAADVKWLEIGPHSPQYTQLYASHRQIVDVVWRSHAPGQERLQLEESSRRPSRAPLGDSQWLCTSAQWLYANLTQTALPLGLPALSVANLLDVFSVAPDALRVATVALSAIEAAPSDDAATASAAIAAQLRPGDAGLAANVFDNLQTLLSLGKWAALRAMLLAAIDFVTEYSEAWRFPNDGSLESPALPPSARAALAARIDSVAMAALRILAFVDQPPGLLVPERVHGIRSQIFEGSRCSMRPCAVVMVGPPGSGKSRSLGHCIPLIEREFDGPPAEHYATINPDDWITQLCDNNNSFRAVANVANHETFVTAIHQRRHVIFDGTGKSVLNTCGRVIARMRAAHYRVFLVVVLASHPTCWRRIELRRAATSRGVPEAILHATLRDLLHAVPLYLQLPSLADATFVFDNNAELSTEGGHSRLTDGGAALPAAPTLLATLTATSTWRERAAAILHARRLLDPLGTDATAATALSVQRVTLA